VCDPEKVAVAIVFSCSNTASRESSSEAITLMQKENILERKICVCEEIAVFPPKGPCWAANISAKRSTKK
jgi:hypothetical protein